MTRRTDEFRDAVRELLPMLVAITPFGMVFGALAADSGLTLAQTMGFSSTIYAGASQLAALQFLALGAPFWSILLAIFALNFRHLLYSASLGRYLQRFNGWQKGAAFFLLVDPLFATAENRAARQPLTKTFYFGYGLLMYAGWALATAFGYAFGGLIPDQRAFGLDILLPVFFLAQVIGFRRRPNFGAVLASATVVSVIVYLTLGAPWHVMTGGLAGIVVAVVLAPKKAAHPGEALPEEEIMP